jgi:hypothetical protein
MDGEEILRKTKCCVCERPMNDSKHCNIYELPYIATWDYPRFKNMFDPESSFHAVAVICDDCAEKSDYEILFALEFTQQGDIIYHKLTSLQRSAIGSNLN